MTAPLNIPDEFIQGLVKSVPALWQALAATYGKQIASPQYWQQQMALWTSAIASATGQPHEPVVTPGHGDRRFSANEWRDNPFLSLLKQTYLLNARLLGDVIEAADMDAKAKHKLR